MVSGVHLLTLPYTYADGETTASLRVLAWSDVLEYRYLYTLK
jgi:hypothetical protein